MAGSTTYDISIEHNVEAVMRDGTVLRADVYRPVGEGEFPVLLTRLPYGKNIPFFVTRFDVLAYARAGFIVVLQDTRGRFSSDGDWEPWTFEEDDGYDTVRWAARLPGSNGNVGMFGESYFGNTQWMAAAAAPPELKAIAPWVTWADPENGLFSRGGATEHGLGLSWTLQSGFDVLARRHAGDPVGRQRALAALVGDIDAIDASGYREAPYGAQPAYARHGLLDLGAERVRREPDWVRRSRVAGRYDTIDVPSLNVGGWYDVFSQGTLDNYMAMRAKGVEAHLVMGPWSHHGYGSQVGAIGYGLAAGADLLRLEGRLLDIQGEWLRSHLVPADERREVEIPPVLIFVQGIDEWREEAEWPLARAVETSIFLRAEGRLAAEPAGSDETPDGYAFDPRTPVPTVGGGIFMSAEYVPGQLDQVQVEARSDVLVYTGVELEHDLEVTGRVRAVIHAGTDGETTDWVVRLCDVDAEGVSRNVVDGVLRARTEPGASNDFEIDLWSTSYVFRAGHRVRVQVTSSSFPRWDVNPNSLDPGHPRIAHQKVYHDAGRPSYVVLPVIP